MMKDDRNDSTPGTRLGRLVDEQIARTVPGTISVAVEKAAEEFAREVLADEAFRRTLHEMIRRRSQALLDALLAPSPPPRRSRGKRWRR
jgi:hypothetical protein